MALSQAESARRAKIYIEKKETFHIQNLFAENRGDLYIVYSYGRHYPMFVYNRTTDTWYENMTKYSQTTARHKNNCRPDTSLVPATSESLCSMIDSERR